METVLGSEERCLWLWGGQQAMCAGQAQLKVSETFLWISFLEALEKSFPAGHFEVDST